MKPSFLQLVPCAAILSLREKIRGMPVFHATDIALSPQMDRDQKTWAARVSDLFLKNLPCLGRWQRSAVITLRDWEEAVSCPPVSFLSPPSSGGESRTAIKGKGKGLRVLRLFHTPTPTRPFPPCRGETACCFFPPGRSLHFSASLSSAAAPSFTGIPAKKNESPEPGGREIPFSTARPEKEILSLLFVSRLTALHFPLEIPALNHLPSNRFIQNRRVFQKPPFLSFSSLSLPCPTGLGRQIAL